MSIVPVYLSSFSSIAPLQRGVGERLGLDRIGRNEKVGTSDKVQKTVRDNDNESKPSSDALVARSGDFVSTYGDVLSISRNVRQSREISVELTDAEKLQVSELKQRDAEVKAHEAAHLGASGALARGGASYEYQKGPDGQNYAVGGEVSIDSSPVEGNPEATIAKAQQIRSAALAPASPSSQDYKVAAKASQLEAEARQELAKTDKNSQDLHDSQDLSIKDHSLRVGEEKSIDNQTTQYVTKSAVSKYAAHSQDMTFRSQSEFRGIA